MPYPFAAGYRVDVCELNHVVGQDGKDKLTQVILWRWRSHNEETDYFVVDWVLVGKDCVIPDKVNGRWIGRFKGRPMRAKVFIETWTWDDWEILDRKRLSVDERW